jgi:hypothetical protein
MATWKPRSLTGKKEFSVAVTQLCHAFGPTALTKLYLKDEIRNDSDLVGAPDALKL